MGTRADRDRGGGREVEERQQRPWPWPWLWPCHAPRLDRGHARAEGLAPLVRTSLRHGKAPVLVPVRCMGADSCTEKRPCSDMANIDLIITSSRPRRTGRHVLAPPDNWPTNVIDLTRGSRPDAGMEGSAVIRKWRLVQAGTLPPDPSSTTLAADHLRRIPRSYPSDRAPTMRRGNRERASAHGARPAVLTQQTRGQTASTGQASDFPLTFFTLEGGLMSQERPFGNSGAEHHPEPNHPKPTEEVTAAAPIPNRFWRMMTGPGFSSPASNPAPFVVTAEAFLDLTSQVQALAGMVQIIVPYLPQLMHSTTHKSAPSTALPQTESPVAPNRGGPARNETATAPSRGSSRSLPDSGDSSVVSHSCDPVQIGPDFDSLSSDTIDSLIEQVCQVHQRLDEVQKEVLKSRGEIGESSKGGSPFTPEIQDKPLPATFKLPTLEPYDGSGDPTEYIAAFHAQMVMYDTSDAL
ncbi:hypothetical protein BHE74_00055317, partial [Ensete ventricosum]